MLRRASPAALVLALAVPFVFLHPVYQVSVTAGPLTADLSDFAILATVVAALVDGVRRGFRPLHRHRAIWIPVVCFALLILASFAWARRFDASYALQDHLVSAAKFLEYMCLAGAAPLALRDEDDRRVFLWTILGWSSFLSLIAVLQFLGFVHQFNGRRPVTREPSYIGHHDLGGFSGAALSAGFAAILLGLRRRLGAVGLVSGAFGIAIAAALDSVGGMLLTAATMIVLARRRVRLSWPRVGGVAVVCVVVSLGAVTLRSAAIKDFLRFLGVSPETKAQQDIQTYAQRTVLMYIGLQIFVHHPLLGVGWQESREPKAFRPYLASARKAFPKAAPASFPSNRNLWGIQNGLLQTLADLGVAGGIVLLAILASAVRLLVRVAARGPPELAWWAITTFGFLIFAVAVFTGSGLLPGLPVDALLWLSVGLAASLDNSLSGAGYPAEVLRTDPQLEPVETS